MASSSASAEARMKSEIERLTATINQHKAHQHQHQMKKTWNGGGHSAGHYSPYPQAAYPRSNAYVNPIFKPANKYVRPGLTPTVGPSRTGTTPTTAAAGPSAVVDVDNGSSTSSTLPVPPVVRPPSVVVGQTKEVVLGGVAFESSSRSLVRKDLPKTSKPVSIGKPTSTSRPPHHFNRKPGHIAPGRAYKPKARRGRNMTLNNTRQPYQSRKSTTKRVKKYIDKPCPRFTTTGACSRGLTCFYQHDPSKIAVCWKFLQDTCSNSAETCNLSHDPTPERTPLCVHFLNNGRCTRVNCHFPHVNVGPRQGVCRDFAVLGYCERGLDCDHQHVRECPDFAEKGTCETKGCKLPHVIRANRNRKVAGASASSAGVVKVDDKMDTSVEDGAGPAAAKTVLTAEDGQLGDEYISLTFKESDSEEEDDDSEEESEDGERDSDGSQDNDDDLEVNM